MSLTLHVGTWNVLHRIHAENWGEPPIERYASEAARDAAVVRMVGRLFALGATVVALQEVSGDVRVALCAALPDGVTVHSHRYGRAPRLRDGRLSLLAHPEEYLLTLVRGGTVSRVHGEDSASDKGKGLLSLELDGVRVINAHLGKGQPGAQLMARIVEVCGDAPRAVIVGDFNADHAQLRPLLPEAFHPAAALPGLTTRQLPPPKVGRWIDHCVVKGGSAEAVEVIAADLPSDHTPVRFAVRWRA